MDTNPGILVGGGPQNLWRDLGQQPIYLVEAPALRNHITVTAALTAHHNLVNAGVHGGKTPVFCIERAVFPVSPFLAVL
jgi:hypothetical protein